MKINDIVKWKTAKPGFSTGKIVDIINGKLKVERHTYAGRGGFRKNNHYFIDQSKVIEVNGEAI